MPELVEMVETDPGPHRDRYALYLLEAHNPAVWELLEVYPTRAEANANAAVAAQDAGLRATRVLAFAPGRPVPRALDNTTGDRDGRAMASAFARFQPEEDAPAAGAARPPREEHR